MQPMSCIRDGGLSVSALCAEKPLELLLGEQGNFVRGILVDELAKGVDAAWRISADSAVQDLRSRLTSFMQVSLLNFPSFASLPF